MIDISRFKVIYRNKVLNAVAIQHLEINPIHNQELFAKGIHELSEINILAVNSNGFLIEICDNAREFQFIPNLKAVD